MSLRNVSYRKVLFSKLIWQCIVIDKLNAGSVSSGQLCLRGFCYLMVCRMQQRAAVLLRKETGLWQRGWNSHSHTSLRYSFLSLKIQITNYFLIGPGRSTKLNMTASLRIFPRLRTRPAKVASLPSLVKAICKRGLKTQGFHTKWTVGKVTFRSVCLLEDL